MPRNRPPSRAPRLLLILAGLMIGLAGMMARAQAPADPGDPPAPPEPQAPPPLSAPRTEIPPEATVPDLAPVPDRDQTAVEVRPPARVYAPQEPPPPVAERRSRNRPGPGAIWTPGYWEWDPDDARFVWVAGSWRVPPARMVWEPGRWVRDPQGWYFVAGAWTRRGDRTTVVVNRPAWQINGPPADRPVNTPPPAPGPGFFYVPGHYAPAPTGDRVAWVAGFWTAARTGWDWIPARWVRRPDRWDYRVGRWIRDSDAVVVERLSPRTLRRLRRQANAEVIARDPITGAEVDIIEPGEPVPVGAVAAGMPYYMLRPPGGMYGPGGMVVPGAVPPFVRRMLDRVLP